MNLYEYPAPVSDEAKALVETAECIRRNGYFGDEGEHLADWLESRAFWVYDMLARSQNNLPPST